MDVTILIRIFRAGALAIFTLCILACGGLDNSAGQIHVDRFHAHFNANQIDRIISEASPALRRQSSEAELKKFFTSVREKLGRYESGETVNWKVASGCSGSTITLVVAAQFEHGKGTETFVFEKSGDEYRLQTYNIQSNVFIVGPDAVDT